MAARGYFTQCLCVLFERAPALEELTRALAGFQIVRQTPPAAHWALAGPGLLLGFWPEVNGCVAVDVVERPWPDDMGDNGRDTNVFGAWTMGFFGPGTAPGSLSRAMRQVWGWDEGAQVVPRHRAFVRIRPTYQMGAAPNAPVVPQGYDPARELLFSAQVAAALLRAPAALGYFCPPGEALASAAMLDEHLAGHQKGMTYLSEMWANVRIVALDEARQWYLLDLVGMGQLDTFDAETVFLANRYDCPQVEEFLRVQVEAARLARAPVPDGAVLAGPGGVNWRCQRMAKGLNDPTREVARWLPQDGVSCPNLDPGALAAATGPRMGVREVETGGAFNKGYVLMLSVTGLGGEPFEQLFAEFKGHVLQWKQQRGQRARAMMVSVITNPERQAEIQRRLAGLCRSDMQIGVALRSLERADLVFGTQQGQMLAEYSLK